MYTVKEVLQKTGLTKREFNKFVRDFHKRKYFNGFDPKTGEGFNESMMEHIMFSVRVSKMSIEELEKACL